MIHPVYTMEIISQQQLEQLDIQQDNITSQTRLLIRIVWIFSYTLISALVSRIIQIVEHCCVVQLRDVCWDILASGRRFIQAQSKWVSRSYQSWKKKLQNIILSLNSGSKISFQNHSKSYEYRVLTLKISY